MQALTVQQRILLCVFFTLLCVAMFSPIANNHYLPISPDFVNHLAIILQAKLALSEGQFPIRVAPWQDHGFGNAFFQFYGSVPYSIAGFIYKFPVHTNPFIAYKLTIGFFYILAGIYLFRLVSWLTKSRSIALLTSVLYLTSPYLLINIDVRGDFPESVAQCIVPIALYYTLRCYSHSWNLKRVVWMAISWFLLMSTHLVTFAYTSIFMGLFLLLITFSSWGTLTSLIRTGVIYLFSFLLTSWFLVPILLTKNYLFVSGFFTNPMDNAWLTRLPTLLSVSAVSPMPLPGNGELFFPLYAAVGWPLLIAVGLLIYLSLEKKLAPADKKNKLLWPLFTIFLLALFSVWSPVDFWKHLPTFLKFLQFTYRLLTQVMWAGALLFCFALAAVFKEGLTARQMAIGILLLGLSAGSWLSTPQSNPITINKIIASPDMGYAKHDYLVKTDFVPETLLPKNKIATNLEKNCSRMNHEIICHINNKNESSVQLPVLYYPKLLKVSVDGNDVSYFPLRYKKELALTGINLARGPHVVQAEFNGITWANQLSLFAWIILLAGFIVAYWPKRSQ